jgi:hypothetical protein
MNFKKIFESLLTEHMHSKQKAGYVAHPVDGHRCDVFGVIKPDGWCKWWKRTHRKDRK